MIRWIFTLVVAIVAMPLAAQSTCQPDVAARAANLARQRQAELLKVKVEEMSTDVAPELQEQIRELKSALAGAVETGMACAVANEDAATMQTRLATMLGANRPEEPFHPSPARSNVDSRAPVYDDGVYGADLKVAVSAPANASEFRMIVVDFGIKCGDDRVVLLYEPAATGWQQTLEWQSGDYTDISGAFGGFFLYSVLPGKDAQSMRLALVHGTDWCTSRWSGFDVDVLAPNGNAAAPRVVWHGQQGFVIESDPRITARADGFELRLDVGTVESDQMVRKGIFRYRVEGDSVTRVQPIAVDGRGFVDAWLQAPWSDAQRWSVAEGLPTFAKVHDQFERSRKNSSVTYSYGPVRYCLMKGRYAVEIDADPGGPMFFGISTAQDGYVMADYSTTQDERCSGPDLMKKR